MAVLYQNGAILSIGGGIMGGTECCCDEVCCYGCAELYIEGMLVDGPTKDRPLIGGAETGGECLDCPAELGNPFAYESVVATADCEIISNSSESGSASDSDDEPKELWTINAELRCNEEPIPGNVQFTVFAEGQGEIIGDCEGFDELVFVPMIGRELTPYAGQLICTIAIRIRKDLTETC